MILKRANLLETPRNNTDGTVQLKQPKQQLDGLPMLDAGQHKEEGIQEEQESVEHSTEFHLGAQRGTQVLPVLPVLPLCIDRSSKKP